MQIRGGLTERRTLRIRRAGRPSCRPGTARGRSWGTSRGALPIRVVSACCHGAPSAVSCSVSSTIVAVLTAELEQLPCDVPCERRPAGPDVQHRRQLPVREAPPQAPPRPHPVRRRSPATRPVTRPRSGVGVRRSRITRPSQRAVRRPRPDDIEDPQYDGVRTGPLRPQNEFRSGELGDPVRTERPRRAAPRTGSCRADAPPYSAAEPSWTNRAWPAWSRTEPSSASTAITFARTRSAGSPSVAPTALTITVGLYIPICGVQRVGCITVRSQRRCGSPGSGSARGTRRPARPAARRSWRRGNLPRRTPAPAQFRSLLHRAAVICRSAVLSPSSASHCRYGVTVWGTHRARESHGRPCGRASGGADRVDDPGLGRRGPVRADLPPGPVRGLRPDRGGEPWRGVRGVHVPRRPVQRVDAHRRRVRELHVRAVFAVRHARSPGASWSAACSTTAPTA